MNFDYVCAFTGTAIRKGNEVFAVGIHDDIPGLVSPVDREFGTNSLASYLHFDEFNFRFILAGRYDDYGFVEGYNSSDYKQKLNYMFMVHKLVVEELVSMVTISEKIDIYDQSRQKDIATILIGLADDSRNELFSNRVELGAVQQNRKEIKLQAKIHKLALEILQEQENNRF